MTHGGVTAEPGSITCLVTQIPTHPACVFTRERTHSTQCVSTARVIARIIAPRHASRGEITVDARARMSARACACALGALTSAESKDRVTDDAVNRGPATCAFCPLA